MPACPITSARQMDSLNPVNLYSQELSMNPSLPVQVAIVTGASRGIGAEIARRMTVMRSSSTLPAMPKRRMP